MELFEFSIEVFEIVLFSYNLKVEIFNQIIFPLIFSFELTLNSPHILLTAKINCHHRSLALQISSLALY